jgi:hypothetical protein
MLLCLRCSRPRGASGRARRPAHGVSADDGIPGHGKAISVLDRREVLMSLDPRTIHSQRSPFHEACSGSKADVLAALLAHAVMQALLPTPPPEPEHQRIDPLPSVSCKRDRPPANPRSPRPRACREPVLPKVCTHPAHRAFRIVDSSRSSNGEIRSHRTPSHQAEISFQRRFHSLK